MYQLLNRIFFTSITYYQLMLSVGARFIVCGLIYAYGPHAAHSKEIEGLKSLISVICATCMGCKRCKKERWRISRVLTCRSFFALQYVSYHA